MGHCLEWTNGVLFGRIVGEALASVLRIEEGVIDGALLGNSLHNLHTIVFRNFN